MQIDLNKLICNTFTGLFNKIVNCIVDRAILKGGRNSTKSAFVSIVIIVGCMIYKQSAVALVLHGNKIRERLVDTFLSSLRFMGLEKYWKLRKSPYELVLLDDEGKETNVSIRFTGCDSEDTLKSYKARAGTYFRYVWFEELTNFRNLKQVNNIIQTMTRGGKSCVIMTYNPPQQSSNWVNKAFDVPVGKILGFKSNEYETEYEFELNNETYKVKQVVHHSTYLDVIESGHADWLGSSWIGEAERTKIENNQYYRFAYLGEITGTDANVFTNIKDWDGDTNKLDLREVFRGMDWSYGGSDAQALVLWGYDRRNKRIYALDEFYKTKVDIPEIADNIKRLNKHNFPIYADSANPLLNQQLINKGLNIINVKKYPDSVHAGIKWLQSLNGVYISKYQTPNIYREFTQYEYELDKDDNITNELPDKNNHSIDATRYAFCNEIKYE